MPEGKGISGLQFKVYISMISYLSVTSENLKPFAGLACANTLNIPHDGSIII